MPSHDAVSVDLSVMTHENRYKFLTASVVPRPIALVTSLSPDGLVNAAPFSQFIILSATPPILGIVSGRHPDGIKDTHSNILTNAEFVINVVDAPLAVATQACAFPFRADSSEADAVGLGTVPSRTVRTPRLAASPIAFECKLSRTERFGNTATLIAGEVVDVHARPGLVSEHRVDHALLQPLGRIAGRSYCSTAEVLHMDAALDQPFEGFRR
jgi:flavin reductase (DIM6/NTAB) family NADH-FMN oxidoreductase RutF